MGIVEELGREIAELSARLDAATHRLLTCIRQFDEQSGWAEQGAVSCAHWLSWRIGLDLATAREKVRVARALVALPAVDAALASGQLSYAKVRAISRIATPDNEATLLQMALYATGAQLERICRGFRNAQMADQAPTPESRSVRRRLLPGGMVKLEIILCPDEADLVMRALDRAREVEHGEDPPHASAERSKGESEKASDAPSDGTSDSASWPSRPDGVVALAESYLAGNVAAGNGGERFQVTVHVDQDPLAADGVMAATLEDGTVLSAETLRRVACDCGLVAVTGTSEALNIGRRTRSIPPAIRRALLLRDRVCAFPGCTHDRFLHGHHIRHWLHGGETSVDNLATLCTAHHHLVHEGGWSIARTAEGELRFTSPAGKPLPAVPAQPWVDDILRWLQEWSTEHGLDLGPDSNLPLWDGTRPDYDLAVAGLLADHSFRG
jgi:hypothetical protein